MAATEDRKMKLKIDGKDYAIDPDDLTLGEVELLETECDAPIEAIDFNRARAMRCLVYVLVHREDPTFEMADAAAVKFSAIGEPDEPEAAGKKRPTKAASAAGE
jgi:hypothetical protein